MEIGRDAIAALVAVHDKLAKHPTVCAEDASRWLEFHDELLALLKWLDDSERAELRHALAFVDNVVHQVTAALVAVDFRRHPPTYQSNIVSHGDVANAMWAIVNHEDDCLGCREVRGALSMRKHGECYRCSRRLFSGYGAGDALMELRDGMANYPCVTCHALSRAFTGWGFRGHEQSCAANKTLLKYVMQNRATADEFVPATRIRGLPEACEACGKEDEET